MRSSTVGQFGVYRTMFCRVYEGDPSPAPATVE